MQEYTGSSSLRIHQEGEWQQNNHRPDQTHFCDFVLAVEQQNPRLFIDFPELVILSVRVLVRTSARFGGSK